MEKIIDFIIENKAVMGYVVLSHLILFLSLIFAFIILCEKYNSKRILTPRLLIMIGIICSSFFLFFPVYYTELDGNISTTVLSSFQHAVRLFTIDDSYLNLREMTIECYEKAELKSFIPYINMYSAIYYIIAPITTFGFILSFFKNASAYWKFLYPWHKEVHIFSELNEKSLALAKNLVDKHSFVSRIKNMTKIIVFTDIINKNEEMHYDLLNDAKEMGAICFSKDLTSINFKRFIIVRKELNIYLFGSDEIEKICHANDIIQHYDKKHDKKHDKKINLYMFSNSKESELFINCHETKSLKFMRINEFRRVIYYQLDNYGLELFRRALASNPTGNKRITVAIIGLGNYGFEMFKALLWYCQIPGYQLEIHIFDNDSNTYSRLQAICPEIMDENYNGRIIKGDAYYHVLVNSDTDVHTSVLNQKICSLDNLTYAFVGIGNDSSNLEVAQRVKVICKRKGWNTLIDTVIYDTAIKENIEASEKPKKNDGGGLFCEIRVIGELNSQCREEVLINKDLEERGLNIHKKWGPEESFRNNEYNWSSSVARAIHEKLCNEISSEGVVIPYADRRVDLLNVSKIILRKTYNEKDYEKKLSDINSIKDVPLRDAVNKMMCESDKKYCDLGEEEKKTFNELYQIMETEHRRWNAYMRSEGWSFCEKRNNDIKYHCNLVPFEELKLEDLSKDL